MSRGAGIALFALALMAPYTGAAADHITVLQPAMNRALPESVAGLASDVAWVGPREVLIASYGSGVSRFGIDSGVATPVISSAAVPEGVQYPESVASDGSSAVAVSPTSPGAFAVRLKDGKRLVAQRGRLIPTDVAAANGVACYLASSMQRENAEDRRGAVWCGGVSSAWGQMKLLHSLHSDAAVSIFRSAMAPLAGRVVIERDGVVDAITAAEPGIYRYSPAGKLIEIRGAALDELVIHEMPEVLARFAQSTEQRYRLVLNHRKIVDDLVVTPYGPALVVRIAHGDKIGWELWFPDARGGAHTRLSLGAERFGPYGHLRCDAREDMLACVGSFPERVNAEKPKESSRASHLLLYHLPKLAR